MERSVEIILGGLLLLLLPIPLFLAIGVVGAGVPGSGGERLIALTVPVMDTCLVLSSVLLFRIYVRNGRRTLAALFALNLVMFGAAALLRLTDTAIPRWVLFSADVYWLHLYLTILARTWPKLNRAAA